MAGMFNSPCCETCTHIRREVKDTVVGGKPACDLHKVWLPDWLPEWRTELVLCNRWRHYNASTSQEEMRSSFPDPTVLYSYPSEYSAVKKKLVALADLPVI